MDSVKKTFDFEKDENGKAVVYRVDGKFTDDHYFKDTIGKIRAEIEQFDFNSQNVRLIIANISRERIGGGMVAGRGGLVTQEFAGGGQRATGSYALISASGAGFSPFTVGHELGHAFGLEHDFRSHDLPEGSYLMSYDLMAPYRLSKGAAEWLDKSRLFDRNERFFDSPPTIERLPVPTDRSDTILLRFKLEDVDRLHQVQLVVPTTTSDFVAMVESDWEANPARKKKILKSLKQVKTYQGVSDEHLLQLEATLRADKRASIPGTEWKLHSYQQLKGQETNTVKFELTDLSVKEVMLRVIDESGNIAKREFNLTENSAEQQESP